MLQLYAIVNSQSVLLDLYPDENITTTISVAEIQDITKKNSVFSQDFRLPGSKTNNQVFQHFYNVNSVQTNYDARNKFEAYLTFDGYVIMSGYLRLNGVSQTNREIIYNANFYNQVGDLAANIGDKFMRELDLDYLQQQVSDLEQNGWYGMVDPDLSRNDWLNSIPNSGITYWSLMNRGYAYSADTGGTLVNFVNYFETPLLQFLDPEVVRKEVIAGTYTGEYPFTYYQTPTQANYFMPSIQLKELYYQVCSQAGYSVVSDFFDTAPFGRLFLPLTFSDTLYPLQSVEPQYAFSSTTPTLSGRTQYFCQTQNCSSATAGSPPQDYILRPITVFRDNFNATTGNNYSFYLPQSGQFHFRATFNAVNTTGGDGTVVMYVMRQFQSPTSFTGLSMSNAGYTITGGTTGETVIMDFNFSTASQGPTLTDYYSVNVFFSTINPNIYIDNLTFELVPETTTPRVLPDTIFDYALEFPENDFKQIDFITSVNKMFNLVVVPEEVGTKTLRVEPIIDYFGTGVVHDWTRLVDRDSPIEVVPSSLFLSGTLEYNLKPDTDLGNDTFFKQQGRIFGTRKEQLNQDYKEQVVSFNPLFSSIVDYVVNTPSNDRQLTLPIFYNVVQQDLDGIAQNFFNPFKTNWTILNRGLNIPLAQIAENYGTATQDTLSWFFRSPLSGNSSYSGVNENFSFPVNNRFSTYPYGVQDYSIYYNFYKYDFYDILENRFTCYEDLYDVYYSDYIDDITADECRIMKCKVFLTPQDIAALDFRDTYFIDGAYWRLNKMTNASLIDQGLADVEMIKTTRSLRPHRVRYYELQSCSGQDSLYSSTDYHATLYAYVGKYIQLQNRDCYLITGTTYNASDPYSPLYPQFAYRYNNFGTVVFDTCAECQSYSGSTARVISGDTYQEIAPFYDEYSCITPSPTPTPTITPSFTPTPTPTTFSCTCIEYELTNTEPFLQGYSYTDCYGASQSGSLGAEAQGVICACEDTILTEPGISISILGDCVPVSLTPTKTPTKTPTPTRTKTPTPTPSNSGGIVEYTYLGRTLVDAADGPAACSSYVTARSYTGLKPLASLLVGDFIYDVYPGTPTNGGGLWVALKTGGIGSAYAFQIDTNGEILDTYTC